MLVIRLNGSMLRLGGEITRIFRGVLSACSTRGRAAAVAGGRETDILAPNDASEPEQGRACAGRGEPEGRKISEAPVFVLG